MISPDHVCIEECIISNQEGKEKRRKKKLEKREKREEEKMSSDDTTLERFVKAQENCYNSVLKELRNGQKRSHWIWFIFPQAAELGNNKKSITLYNIV